MGIISYGSIMPGALLLGKPHVMMTPSPITDDI